ncbi:hypothetical protein FOMPIDRAFT_1048340 [Fomitopsis schrenkii]|uniref:Uncharacterized protein n=1 Tax=Fomitopsis schrenkii TaxID=2126942 RepID=S8EBP7_FOMSC|nr:hypothetical protein FOMPIDRAFT_1048340 [Fomitopsis schrenkii]
MTLKSFLRSMFCHLPNMSDSNVQLVLFLYPGVSPEPARTRKFDIGTLEYLWLTGDLRLHSCILSGIRLYKPRGPSTLEYVVVDITYSGSHIGSLRIERIIDPLHRMHPTPSLSTISTTSTRSSPGLAAHEYIVLFMIGRDSLMSQSAEEIAFYTPDSSQPIPFAAIIAACFEVDRDEAVNHLLTDQCYRFAGLVIQLMVGDCNKLRQSRHASWKEGEWHTFLEVMSDRQMIEGARRLVDKYQGKLQSLVQAGPLARADIASELRRCDSEEAQRRDEEAQRRIEEAQRRIAELECMLKEASAMQHNPADTDNM